ncbi:MAG TPA: MaoC/PaaZ C-terminal domain-containing protein [Dongiaceae bacterium]
MKTSSGNFFEDFQLGQVIRHSVPRTVTAGDVALYIGLTGSRFALPSSDEFAQGCGFQRAPIDDLLVFHMVFGRTVADISLNAVANLGYAGCRFGIPVFPGDSLSAVSTVIGLKENSNRETGTVYVRTVGLNDRDQVVLDYIRWVMVRKRDAAALAPEPVVPDLPKEVGTVDFTVPEFLDFRGYDPDLAGSRYLWEDYAVGEKIDHVDGMTLEEADHMTAARLYQNNAKVHFNQLSEAKGRFGKRLVYGGHIISLARALSCNGLANAFRVAAIHGGRHVAPSFAGDTVYAWTEVLARDEMPARPDIGALRLRTIATKDHTCADFPSAEPDGKYLEAVVLDLDYSVLMPRRR